MRFPVDDVEEVDGCSCDMDTPKACLVRLPSGVKLWCPKSVIHDDSEVYRAGTSGKLVVARRWAEKEGIG